MRILEELKSIASTIRPGKLHPKPGVRRAALKELLVLFGILFFVLGGGVISVVLFSFSIHAVLPELSQRGLKTFEILTIIPVLFVFLLLGMLVGSIFWLFAAKSRFSRDELNKYFTRPYVPFITPLLSWMFERIYQR